MGSKEHKLSTYTQDYNIILSAITKRLPIAYCKWSTVNGISSEDYTIILDSVIKGFKKYVLDHSEYIFSETKTKINNYLNTFEVAPNDSIDEFKLIFFLSTTLSENLKNNGLDLVAKIVLTAMVWLLDYRLNTVSATRKILTDQIIKMIERNQLPKETGDVGLYLTYKCLYNQAKETKELSP